MFQQIRNLPKQLTGSSFWIRTHSTMSILKGCKKCYNISAYKYTIVLFFTTFINIQIYHRNCSTYSLNQLRIINKSTLEMINQRPETKNNWNIAE